VEDQSSTHDGEDTEHGVLVQLNADLEFRPEAVHVSPETLVALDAQDHQLKLEPVELLLSTHDGEDTEPGVLVQLNADPEFKPEADHVLPETLAELDVQDHQLNHEPVELLLSTHDWELSEHGAHVLPHVDLELNLEAVFALLVTNVVLLAVEL